MGFLGDLAKAAGLSSGSDTNSNSGSNPNADSNSNSNANTSSWSDIFSTPPTVIKANGGAPGPICDQHCSITDAAQCTGCLEQQVATMSGIREIRTLERVLKIYENKPAVFVPRRMKQCAVCSAPFESGKSVCDYCGTPYPEDLICGDIPDDMDKRGDFFAAKCEEAYKRFTDWEKYRKKLEEVGTVGKLFGMLSKGKLESRNMTAAEIKEGAASKNLSCTDYIGGIIHGKIKPASQEKRETTMLAVAGTAAVALAATAAASAVSAGAKAAAKSSAASTQTAPPPTPAPSYTPRTPVQPRGYTPDPYLQRSKEIEAEHQRKLAEIRAEKNRIQQNAARYRSAPAYGEVPNSSCCGNCKHYMAVENKCAYSEYKHPTGASDYCGNYWSK